MYIMANICNLMNKTSLSEEFNELLFDIASMNNLFILASIMHSAQIALDKNQIDIAKSLLKEQDLMQCFQNCFGKILLEFNGTWKKV